MRIPRYRPRLPFSVPSTPGGLVKHLFGFFRETPSGSHRIGEGRRDYDGDGSYDPSIDDLRVEDD